MHSRLLSLGHDERFHRQPGQHHGRALPEGGTSGLEQEVASPVGYILGVGLLATTTLPESRPLLEKTSYDVYRPLNSVSLCDLRV